LFHAIGAYRSATNDLDCTNTIQFTGAPRPNRPHDPDPLYRQIATALELRIRSGELALGSNRPAERTLADELEVNRSTIASAYADLAHRISPDCCPSEGRAPRAVSLSGT
jgi:hypothetical protein